MGLASRTKGTKLEQLVDALWDEFGGAGRMADLIHQAYLQAKDGSMTQVRIVDSVMKLMMSHDSRHGKSVDQELDDMTEKQLEAIFEEMGSNADLAGPIDPGEADGEEGKDPACAGPAELLGFESDEGDGEGSSDSPSEDADGEPEVIRAPSED